jgi:hypothetical protein
MTRDEAIEQGSKTYNGKECKYGHGTERYVTNWGCTRCIKELCLTRDPDVSRKYAESEKGKGKRKEYRKTPVYRSVQNKYKRKHYETNKDQYHGYSLKKYGITCEQYYQMLTEQDNSCAICHTDTNVKRLAVHHCHDTGKTRGLLCSQCNTALGLLKENIELMTNMIKYVGDHK